MLTIMAHKTVSFSESKKQSHFYSINIDKNSAILDTCNFPVESPTPTDSGYSGSDTSPFSESPTIGRPKLKLFLNDEPDTLSDVHDFNKDTTKIPSPFAYSKRTSATRTCVSQINQNRTSPVIAGKKSSIYFNDCASPSAQKKCTNRKVSLSKSDQLQLSLLHIFRSKPFLKPKVITLKEQLYTDALSGVKSYDETIDRLNKIKKKLRKHKNQDNEVKACEAVQYTKNLRMGKFCLTLSDIEEEEEMEEDNWKVGPRDITKSLSGSFMELVFGDEDDDVTGLFDALSCYNFMYELNPSSSGSFTGSDEVSTVAEEEDLDPVFRINNRQSMRRACDHLTRRIRSELSKGKGQNKQFVNKNADKCLLTATSMSKTMSSMRKTMRILYNDSSVK